MKTVISLCALFVIACLATEDPLVLTPFGYLPKSCVYSVESEANILNGERTTVIRKDGSMFSPEPCRAQPTKAAANLPSGWAAYSLYQSANPLHQFNGVWSVPPTPKDQSTQTLFLFTGLQNSYEEQTSVVNIIQPVIQFGPSSAGGGQYWAMASWYVDSNSNAFFSTLTPTQSGHQIVGTMVKAPTGKWNIVTQDATSGRKTTLSIATNTTEPWAFVTLEVYSVSSCLEYPTGSDVFSKLSLVSTAGPVTPKWQTVATPGCEESVKINSPSQVTVKF